VTATPWPAGTSVTRWLPITVVTGDLLALARERGEVPPLVD
jgi:hypothetical protein